MIRGILATALMILAGTPLSAQMRVQQTDGSEVLQIAEVGAMLMQEGDAVKVGLVLPKESRPEAYRGVDIERDDIVLFLNGKRIRKVADFRAVYDSLKIDTLVEVGLKRDEKRFIASFKKADPASLPQRRMVMMSSDQESGDSGEGQPRMVLRVAGPEGESELRGENLRPIPELGFIAGEQDSVVTLMRALPVPGLPKLDLQTGDVLLRLNGKPITTLDAFATQFEQLKTGASIELGIRRGGAERQVAFAKPERPAGLQIRRND